MKIIDTKTAIEALKHNLLRIDECPEWSNTRYEAAARCMTEYALEYIFHVPSVITPDVARGDLLHSIIHGLWVLDEKSGLIIPGYSSYDACIGSATRDWYWNFVREERPRDRSEIEWKSKGQRFGKWYIGEIANIMGMVYTKYLHEERPVASELEIHGVEVNGIRLMAKIDELRFIKINGREKLAVIDHKSGRRNYGDEYYLKNNTQMTTYLLCLYHALQDINSGIHRLCPEKLKRFVGMSLEDFLENTVIGIHHLVEPKRKSEEDHKEETKVYFLDPPRELVDFREFSLAARSRQSAIKRRDFCSNRNKCGTCFKKYSCRNFDMAEIFGTEYRPEQEELFDFSDIQRRIKPQIYIINNIKVRKARRQKIMRFPKTQPIAN
jgi:hypothetical protein